MQPQVILITGASSGFGKITAQMLSERGHIVYGTSRKPSEDMNHVKMLVVDVTNFLSVCQAVRRKFAKVHLDFTAQVVYDIDVENRDFS